MKPLRIGTDCSGIEAPIQALQQLGLPFTHVFSADIDKYCLQSIKANYSPQIIFGDSEGPYPEGDITKRKISDVPDIDVYVCGFPCQPFSTAGNRKGFDDQRGNVFFSCLKVIKQKKPKLFILENVRGLLNHDKGNTWKIILEKLQELCKYGYKVEWKILNTKHYGIPQNRDRLYIVGKLAADDIVWPEKVPLNLLEDYIDQDDNERKTTTDRHETILKNHADKLFIDLAYGVSATRTFANAKVVCPCITVKNSIWCVPKHRHINVKELMRLQGFDYESWKQVVSNFQLKKQIGNSMSVNILKAILSSNIDPS